MHDNYVQWCITLMAGNPKILEILSVKVKIEKNINNRQLLTLKRSLLPLPFYSPYYFIFIYIKKLVIEYFSLSSKSHNHASSSKTQNSHLDLLFHIK